MYCKNLILFSSLRRSSSHMITIIDLCIGDQISVSCEVRVAHNARITWAQHQCTAFTCLESGVIVPRPI